MISIKDFDPGGKYAMIKKNDSDTIFWIDDIDHVGIFMFTFDKVVLFNLFEDYPHNLTKDQKETFDKENPYWKDFFKDRK